VTSNQFGFCSTFWFGHMYGVKFVWNNLFFSQCPSFTQLSFFSLSYRQKQFVVLFILYTTFIFLFFSWVCSFQCVLEAVVAKYLCMWGSKSFVYGCRVVAFQKYGHAVVEPGPHHSPFPATIIFKMSWPMSRFFFFSFFWLQPNFLSHKTWDETIKPLVL
jgi:hypothetical protein